MSLEQALQAGEAKYEAGQYPEALVMFDRAAALDRERPEPSFHRGRCYLAMARQRFERDLPIGAMRNCDQAIACFDDAIAAFPGFSSAFEGKAEALRLKGRYTAAQEIADWVAEYSGAQAKKLILKARTHARSGDMDQAQLAFKQATSVEPDNAATHAALGLFYLRCGNEAAAVRSLERAYELDPGAPGVVTALARLGALSGASDSD